MENYVGGFMGIRFDGGGAFGYCVAGIVNFVGGIYYDYGVNMQVSVLADTADLSIARLQKKQNMTS
jgi:hypothetical protein